MSDDAQEAALGLLGLIHTSSSTSTTTTPVIPQKRKPPPPVENPDSIRCICSYTHDDGWSVACDRCGRWYHGVCVDIAPGSVPQFWVCPEHEENKDPAEEQARRERAQAIQRQHQRRVHEQQGSSRRRATSPGVEKKQRRINSGELKKRRRSISKPTGLPQSISAISQPTISSAAAATTTDEDEHIVIDVEDTYITVQHDAVPLQETRERLARNAQNWRGITALDMDDETFIQPTTTTTSRLRPVDYGLHTSVPVKANDFIAPYNSTVTPSSDYLSNPLNAYAHLGMPKPFVHIIGPPHNVALDSRIRGSRSRFARSGCHPNAVLRPYLCADKISFGIFALRDLKPNEEVVLGWEWDDGNAIHHLPALLEHPELFTQEQHQYLRFQLANLLHSLGSTFATCACGSESRNCALKRVTDFVDGVEPDGSKAQMGPLVGVKRGFRSREKVAMSSGMSGVEMVDKEQLRAIGIDYQEEQTAAIPPEEALPPRMRKRWIHEKREELKQIPEPMQLDEKTRPKMPAPHPPYIPNFPPTPSPSVQFATLSLHSPACQGIVPQPLIHAESLRMGEAIDGRRVGTTEEPHVRFATSPPVIHPLPSPPPSTKEVEVDIDVGMKVDVDVSTEGERPRSPSVSSGPSPQFESRTLPQSPETTPSPPEIPSHSPIVETCPPPDTASTTVETSSVPPPSPPASHSPPVSESPAPRTPTPPPTTPVQPTKVKMSLKDFAMRKKKQRAQEEPEAKELEEEKKEEDEKKRVEEKERLRHAHIHRSTLSFGSFGIDDGYDDDIDQVPSRSVSPMPIHSVPIGLTTQSTPSPSISPDLSTIPLSPLPHEPVSLPSPSIVRESLSPAPTFALPSKLIPQPPPSPPSLPTSLPPPPPLTNSITRKPVLSQPLLSVPQTPPPPARSPSPGFDQEEGEITTTSPPPSLKVPPTQPRSFSTSRPPPSGPRALRNGSAGGSPGSTIPTNLITANGGLYRGGWRGRGRGSWVR